MGSKEEFLPLTLPVMLINISKENKYQVYSDEKEFVTIEAENAATAIEKSKIDNPYKIIHIVNDAIDFIDKSQLINSEKPNIEKSDSSSDANTVN